MSMHTRITVTGLLVCGLAACGGGGGGDSTPGTITTVFPALALTSSNAEEVAGDVATVGSDTVGAGDIGTGIITGVVIDAAGRPALSEIARWSLETVHGLRDQLIANVTGVVINEVVNCDSGTISVTWDDADNDSEFSSGDTFSMTFNTCALMGVTINGALAMTGFTITGNPSTDIAWSMGATFTYTALTMSDGVDSVRIDGGMGFSIATLDSDDFEVEISGSSLAYREGIYTTTLRNYSFSYTEEVSSGLFSLGYAGIIDIGSLTGRVSFTTTTPFTGSDILANWPTAGELLISGDNSTVTLTALGGDSVRLSIDSNGDGGTDQT
ncbi:MAG TPA: hypothetical protein VLB27_06705, partial [candidate division Zixibacteria bacterium]|nr:hypothetical protein [candidate division Zixibacteria bacterium]